MVILFFIPLGNKSINSIAVLPLENISGDPEQEYFADGMTDALIGELGKIGALRVISRRSVMQYKGVYKSITDIGKELDADVIVEGTVLNIGDQVRIIIQLIDARKDKNLWDGQYQSELRNVLRLQSSVAQEIAKEIRIKITPEEKSLLTVTRDVNKEAYQKYLQGLHHYNKSTLSDYQQSITLFNEAIGLDSLFAEAYAGLANTYAGLVSAKYMSADEGWAKVKLYAEKAIRLNPHLPSPYVNLAEMNINFDWNWTEAENQITSVLKLHPNDWFAYIIYADYLAANSQFELAVLHTEKALIINPLSSNTHQQASVIFRMVGRYDKAEKQLETAVELDSSYSLIYASYAKLYLVDGKYKKAIEVTKKTIELTGESSRMIRFAQCYAYLGMVDSAKIMIDRALKVNEIVKYRSFDIAIAYIALNDYDSAFYWLEQALEDRSPEIHWIKVDKRLDPIRGDPRFRNILRKMNLE
jgi:adenylate cyclase